MYHFISFFGILFSSVFPFRFPLIVLPLSVHRPAWLPVSRRPSRCANRVACRVLCRYMPASRSSFICIIAFRRLPVRSPSPAVLACRPHVADVGISPLPVSVGGAWGGELRFAWCRDSCSVSPAAIELTKTVHPGARLWLDCAVPASPYSVHIIYTMVRYYVFIKRRSRRQCPMDGDIGSEVFQNEGIPS